MNFYGKIDKPVKFCLLFQEISQDVTTAKIFHIIHYAQLANGNIPLTNLATHIPHILWIIVGGVRPQAAGIGPAQLSCIVLHKFCPLSENGIMKLLLLNTSN